MVRAMPPLGGSTRSIEPMPALLTSEPVTSAPPLTLIALGAVYKMVWPLEMTRPPLLMLSVPIPPVIPGGMPPKERLVALVQIDPGPVTVAVATAGLFWPIAPTCVVMVAPLCSSSVAGPPWAAVNLGGGGAVAPVLISGLPGGSRGEARRGCLAGRGVRAAGALLVGCSA